jgi:hypothetical protein
VWSRVCECKFGGRNLDSELLKTRILSHKKRNKTNFKFRLDGKLRLTTIMPKPSSFLLCGERKSSLISRELFSFCLFFQKIVRIGRSL